MGVSRGRTGHWGWRMEIDGVSFSGMEVGGIIAPRQFSSVCKLVFCGYEVMSLINYFACLSFQVLTVPFGIF